MKQIIKGFFSIAVLSMMLFMPFSVSAQDEESAPILEPGDSTTIETEEETISEPILEETEESATEDAEESMEEEGAMEEVSDEETSGTTTVDDTKTIVLPELRIHAEQLGWNKFRLRPSYRLGIVEDEYRWSLGDGGVSNERVIEHTFSSPGTYQVELRIVDADGSLQDAVAQVHVGFFHLANWRLWVLIGLLALIIILAAVFAGVTDSIVPKQKPARLKKILEDATPDDELFESLSDTKGTLDTLASTGMSVDDLSDELALLESLDAPAKITPKPKKAAAGKAAPKATTKKAAVKPAKAAPIKVAPKAASKQDGTVNLPEVGETTTKAAPVKKAKTAKKKAAKKSTTKKKTTTSSSKPLKGVKINVKKSKKK